jgi:myosin heavy subunit
VQSSLAQLGIPFNDVVKVLVAILLLGNILFYEAKNQELSMQGGDGTYVRRSEKDG